MAYAYPGLAFIEVDGAGFGRTSQSALRSIRSFPALLYKNKQGQGFTKYTRSSRPRSLAGVPDRELVAWLSLRYGELPIHELAAWPADCEEEEGQPGGASLGGGSACRVDGAPSSYGELLSDPHWVLSAVFLLFLAARRASFGLLAQAAPKPRPARRG